MRTHQGFGHPKRTPIEPNFGGCLLEGFLIGPIKFDMIWRWFALVLAFLSSCLGPDLPSDWASFLWAGVELIFILCSLAFYVYFHKCPPTNGQTPKLVELISYKS